MDQLNPPEASFFVSVLMLCSRLTKMSKVSQTHSLHRPVFLYILGLGGPTSFSDASSCRLPKVGRKPVLAKMSRDVSAKLFDIVEWKVVIGFARALHSSTVKPGLGCAL